MQKFTANQWKDLAIAAATLLALGLATWVSLKPDYYFFRTDEAREHWEHPTVNFLIVCAFLIAEGFFISRIIRLGDGVRLWLRTLIGSAVLLPWVLISSMFVVHAPGYMHLHIVWVWLLLVALVAAFLCSAFGDALRAVRRKRAV